MRVNSAGFGGANYHLSLSEFLPQHFTEKHTIYSSNEDICLVGQSKIPYRTSPAPERASLFKIPPHELLKLDPSQTLGLIALSQALERSLINLETIPSHRVGVISASHTRTNKIEALTETIFLKQIERFLSETLAEDPSALKQIRDNLIVLDESSCQSINSMTSGRLAHEFDLHGVNFHVDADFNSESHAILVAHHFIRKKRLDLVIVLSINESIPESQILIQRDSITCSLFAGLNFANSYNMPVIAKLKLGALST
jgi:acyl transferase domain-containing protein